MAVMTSAIESSAAANIPGYDPRQPYGMREHLYSWRKGCAELFDAEVAKVADERIKERLSGPYVHKYKGVAVTEDQFWQFMKLEGFERPEEKA